MKKQLAVGLFAIFAAGNAQAAKVFGVDGNDNLVSFNSSAPGAYTSSVKITGAEGILGLDFRPLDNTLYGLASDHVIYTINTTTGLATAASGVLDLGPLSTQFAFDFNPTVDRIRIISNADNNFVFNPNNGSLTTATSVFYAAGDVNQGKNPNVTAVAYTSSVFGAPSATSQLFGVDTTLDVLTKVANSAGRLDTVGGLGVNVGSRDSFDIRDNDAFVIDGRNFYSVNLATGGLTFAGQTNDSLFGLAISAAPEPSTWAMLIGGFGLVGAAMRRRRSALVPARS